MAPQCHLFYYIGSQQVSKPDEPQVPKCLGFGFVANLLLFVIVLLLNNKSMDRENLAEKAQAFKEASQGVAHALNISKFTLLAGGLPVKPDLIHEFSQVCAQIIRQANQACYEYLNNMLYCLNSIEKDLGVLGQPDFPDVRTFAAKFAMVIHVIDGFKTSEGEYTLESLMDGLENFLQRSDVWKEIIIHAETEGPKRAYLASSSRDICTTFRVLSEQNKLFNVPGLLSRIQKAQIKAIRDEANEIYHAQTA